MSWIRESISDSDGLADMAYIAIAGLVLVMVGSVLFLCSLSAISYWRCTEIVDVGQGVRSAIPCKYDPNPLGVSIAACLAAFGSPIGALALYMGQTRRAVNPGKVAPPAGPVVTTTTRTAVGDGAVDDGAVEQGKSGRGRPGKPKGELG